MLEPLRAADAAELFEIRGDAAAMTFWDWPHDATPAETATAVASMLEDVAVGDACYWALRLRVDRRFVGVFDLSELRREPHSADIGFMIVRRFWGQGLAAEGAALVVERGRQLGLTTLHARIHSDNARSARLLMRLGFTLLATIPAFEIRPGTFRACSRFELALF